MDELQKILAEFGYDGNPHHSHDCVEDMASEVLKLREAVDTFRILAVSKNHQAIELMRKNKELEDDVEALEAKLQNARYDHSKVSIHGTDGCLNCETGRITIFAASRWCYACLAHAWESPRNEGAND